MRFIFLLLLVWALPASADPQEDARAALAQCMARLDGHEKATFAEISFQCPFLPAAVEASSYSSWLPESWWQDSLRYAGLVELRDLIERLEAPAIAQPLDTALLQPVLDEIRQVEIRRSQSWFQRARQWLLDRMQRQGSTGSDWIGEWAKKIESHHTLFAILQWSLFILLVVLAIGILFNELRVAGLLSRQRAAGASPVQHAAAAAGAVDDNLEGIEPSQRPSFLLERVLATLAGKGRARGDRALTHRELQRELRFELPAHASGFARLVRCAERVRYSPQLPPGAEIESAVTSGRELLGALGAQ